MFLIIQHAIRNKSRRCNMYLLFCVLTLIYSDLKLVGLIELSCRHENCPSVCMTNSLTSQTAWLQAEQEGLSSILNNTNFRSVVASLSRCLKHTDCSFSFRSSPFLTPTQRGVGVCVSVCASVAPERLNQFIFYFIFG